MSTSTTPQTWSEANEIVQQLQADVAAREVKIAGMTNLLLLRRQHAMLKDETTQLEQALKVRDSLPKEDGDESDNESDYDSDEETEPEEPVVPSAPEVEAETSLSSPAQTSSPAVAPAELTSSGSSNSDDDDSDMTSLFGPDVDKNSFDILIPAPTQLDGGGSTDAACEDKSLVPTSGIPRDDQASAVVSVATPVPSAPPSPSSTPVLTSFDGGVVLGAARTPAASGPTTGIPRDDQASAERDDGSADAAPTKRVGDDDVAAVRHDSISPVKKILPLALPGGVAPTQLEGDVVSDAARKSMLSVPISVISGSQALAAVKTALPAMMPPALPTGAPASGIATIPAAGDVDGSSSAVPVVADTAQPAGSQPVSPAAGDPRQFVYRCRIVHKRSNGCGRDFANPASLRNHMERVHQLFDTEHTFDCGMCGKRFLAQSAYDSHYRKMPMCSGDDAETASWVKGDDADYPVTRQQKADTWLTTKYGRPSQTVKIPNPEYNGVKTASPSPTPAPEVIDLTDDDQTAVRGQGVAVAGTSTSPSVGVKRKRTAQPDEAEQAYAVQSRIRGQGQLWTPPGHHIAAAPPLMPPVQSQHIGHQQAQQSFGSSGSLHQGQYLTAPLQTYNPMAAAPSYQQQPPTVGTLFAGYAPQQPQYFFPQPAPQQFAMDYAMSGLAMPQLPPQQQWGYTQQAPPQQAATMPQPTVQYMLDPATSFMVPYYPQCPYQQ